MEQIFLLGKQETNHQLACRLKHTLKGIRMRKFKDNGAIVIIIIL